MPQGEHSAILLIFIKQPFVIKIFVLSIFEWPFYTGFTVHIDTIKERGTMAQWEQNLKFGTHHRLCVVSLSKTLYPLLSTGLTLEDPPDITEKLLTGI